MTFCHGPAGQSPVRARMSGRARTAVTRYENHASPRLAELARPLLENRELMRIPRALALLAPVLLSLPSSAAAQTQGEITITMTSVSQGGTQIRSTVEDEDFSTRGFNADECDIADDITAQFALLNLPTATTFVDAWLGNSSQDCSTADARQTGTQRQCIHLGNPSVASNTISVPLSEMLNPDDSACDGTPQNGAKFNLWLFATNSTETTGEVDVSQFGYVTFTIDVAAPEVPALDATTLTGGSAVSVSWATPVGEISPQFRVFVDDSVADCSAASSLMPGGEAPDDSTHQTTDSDYSVTLSGFAVGREVAVYVASVDQSENVSVLSERVCVTVVQTVGFCEALEASGEECTNSCAVGSPGSGSTTHVWWLVGCAVALAARRRWRS